MLKPRRRAFTTRSDARYGALKFAAGKTARPRRFCGFAVAHVAVQTVLTISDVQ